MPTSRLRRTSRVLTALLVILSMLLQIGFQPAARAATSITLDFPMPAGFDRADLTAWATEFNNRNDLLSETIQEEIAAHPADFPGAEDLEPREFDGAFTVTATGLSVTIGADVHIGDLTWWEEVLMWVSVTAGGVVFRIVCVLTLVPVMANPNFAKGICAGLAVIISKGLILLITALKHGPSDDWHFWERALAALVLEAITAAVWDAWLGPWTAKSSWSSVFKTIGDGFDSVANTVSRWWGSSAGFFRTLAGVVRGRGPGTTASTVERAMELGWMPRTTALRVMPLGDSITHGVGGDPGGVGYRARLWDLLQDDTSTLDFVGSVDSGQGHIADTDHEGHPRWRISQIDRLAAECAINRHRPNVVVLHIGTNDLANDEGADTAHLRLGTLVRSITDLSPLTTVILSSLVPAKDQTDNSLIAMYNSRLPALVTLLRTEGRRVRLVGNGALGFTAADLADSLHPNNNGYRKMADAYHAAINAAMDEGLIMPALQGDDRPCTPAPANPAPPPPGPAPAGWNYVGRIASVAGASREQVRFADLNGDGRDDYLLVGEQGQVRAWINNRAGQGGGWNHIGEIATGAAPRHQVRFADLNGDGRDDYLVVGDQGQVSMWLNTGTGDAVGWASQGVVATGVGATRDQVRFADVDVDGRDDYLVVDDQGRVRAWLNQFTPGGGAWSYRGEIASGVGATRDQVRFHDLDGDGDDDYLVVDGQGYFRAWLNNVGGNRPWIYQGAVAGGVGVGGAGLAMADIDGNGRDDFLTVDDAGEVAAWLNDRYGRPDPWDRQGQIASTEAPREQVRFADLNGDGRDDYLLVGDQGQVQAWLNVREADRVGWDHRGEVASGSGPRDRIRFADLNGDNRDDYLVVGDQGQVDAWFNSGAGDAVAWSGKGRLASGAAPRDQIRFADVDGDNRDDYLVVDDQGRVRFWRNIGTGDGVSWSSQGEIASGVGAAGSTVTFADVDGDRRDDYLVVGDYGQLRAWINNRGGSGPAWLAAGEIAAGVGAVRSRVGLAEINGDRRADYLVHDDLGGVKAWFNNGASASTGSPMPDDPQPPSPGDLPLCVANRCW
ncbi:lipolytic protein G-D-S-L family [Herbidospora sp. NEAU-GS84]|uniref:Lipolytic protein G-D-S-L family n=1 Tax=Herbidospora solisilvae TaxID=2696284 RepID=A0A7C9N1W7_9ACTN|nr:FG-GAP-like repeat-containing protein [Herbidospora solisilvae]NAS26971.1 lipolytic protein G-D-S-L family [Herbidospora solisilvae]